MPGNLAVSAVEVARASACSSSWGAPEAPVLMSVQLFCDAKAFPAIDCDFGLPDHGVDHPAIDGQAVPRPEGGRKARQLSAVQGQKQCNDATTCVSVCVSYVQGAAQVIHRAIMRWVCRAVAGPAPPLGCDGGAGFGEVVGIR